MSHWIDVRAQDTEVWNIFQQALTRLLDAAIEASNATKGNLQLFNRKRGELEIVAQRGFDTAFLRQLERLRTDNNTICCRAFRMGRRIVVSDVNTDPAFEPYRAIAVAADFRAVQSTPILTGNGSVVGVFSTHSSAATHLPAGADAALDDLSDQMAILISDLDVAEAGC